MLLIAPDYYRDFACIKGACRHSCCIGWKIDIDEDTLAYYHSLEGAIAGRIFENVEIGDEGAHFRLGRDERCPFLNGEGLCDLILELGEDSLCQICSDHPRFRNFYADREEIGLGLSCEAAARLILTRRERAALETIADDAEACEGSADDAELLCLRDQLIAFAQERALSIEDRVRSMLSFAEIDLGEIDYGHWLSFFLSLERLDDSWTKLLENAGADEPAGDIPEALSTPFEQLLVYLLYRHISCDDDLSGRIAYCALIVLLLKHLLGNGGIEEFLSLARLYSSEIEYSDENLFAILDELHRVYPQI